MSRFDEYFLMKEADVIDYVREKIQHLFSDEELLCKEIGDGNINYIYKVFTPNNSKSIIIKQSGPYCRVSEDFPLSQDRNRIEYEILKLQASFEPEMVPTVYNYDSNMFCTAMEDLSDHQILRHALLEGKTFPKFADHISSFMVKTLMSTTDAVMGHKEKKELVASFINPGPCEISEELVYTEPFNDIRNRNHLFLANTSWINENIYNDDELKLETAKLKFDFMTKTQALIHGDLHTGSIFVKEDSTKVIDPEFAFFGPIGFDVGNVIANLFFAWANADANSKTNVRDWCERTIVDVVDLFIKKWSITWNENVTETVTKYPGFSEWYLDGILSDTAGVAGLETARRISGFAKVEDIKSIQNEHKRIRAERICLMTAKSLILNRNQVKIGKDYLDIILNFEKDF